MLIENQILVFALLLVIILVSPVIFKRIGIPSIIVLILSGVIIGPYGLYLIEETQSISLLADVGLLYIMFIAGLDLDLGEFYSAKYKSITYGLLTFVIPFSIGFLFCTYVLQLSLEACLLLSSLFSTQTPITYPIASKMGVAKNQAIAVTVGGTIVTNTIALLLLAVVLGQQSGNVSPIFFVEMLVAALILTFLIFYVFPTICKWFFRRLESEKYSHFLLILSMMFLSSYFSEVLGFEGIIGAFLSGIALNRLVPNSSTLMNRIDFVGNTLFIPVFLISVGMLVDVSVVFEDSEIITLAVLLIVISLSGKWLSAFLTQQLFRYSVTQRRLIFGLSGSRAAATLAITLVGVRTGLMTEEFLNAAVVLILVTCIIASFVTQQSAKVLAMEENKQMGIQQVFSGKKERIFLPISLESHFEQLLDFALLLKDSRSIYPLTVGSVVPNNFDSDEQLVSTRVKLERYVKEASAAEIQVNVLTTLDFNISGGIVRLSRESMADFIVMGWPRQMGFVDKLIGENAGGVVMNTDKTIFICQIERALIVHHRIILVVPQLAEFEKGFSLWLRKVAKISRELTTPVLLFSEEETYEHTRLALKKMKVSLDLEYHRFADWNNFLSLMPFIDNDDLLFVVSARSGTASYQKALEQIPIKLETYFKRNNKVIIYPQRFV